MDTLLIVLHICIDVNAKTKVIIKITAKIVLDRVYKIILHSCHFTFYTHRNTDSPTLKAGSPTLKKVFDFDVTITTKSSPKRKTFAEVMPWDNQNIPTETSSPKRKTIRD